MVRGEFSGPGVEDLDHLSVRRRREKGEGGRREEGNVEVSFSPRSLLLGSRTQTQPPIKASTTKREVDRLT